MTEDNLLMRLPNGISSRLVENGNGLNMHVLEAGAGQGRPTLLLLHGFPELAFSWRKIMLPLADAGFHVIAPDQRGYGRTTGWVNSYDTDLRPFAFLGLLTDLLGLLNALEISEVHGVIGHDFGSPVAGTCALVRPDVFKRVVLMSAPYPGAPGFAPKPAADVIGDLGRLDRPRVHYQWYYSTPEANLEMTEPPQGLHDFLRAYYHHKSADWTDNKPYRLESWSAGELAKLPTYYVMEAGQTMAETVAPEMPDGLQVATCDWLPDEDLAVYTEEYGRNGFQGGLNWYRCGTTGLSGAELRTFAGKMIDIPAMFISGRSDWGTFQKPGDLEAMESRGCTDWRGTHLVDGAGHWVQQEQPQEVVRLLLDFL